MKPNTIRRSILVLFAVALSLAQGMALGDSCELWYARTISVQGSVQLKKAGDPTWSPVHLDERLCPGDSLKIAAQSRAAIQLPNDTIVRLDQNTTITFSEKQEKSRSWLELLKGAAHFISRDPRALKVITPFANAAIEGTEFAVQVGEDKTDVTVFEGQVEVSNEAGHVDVKSGQTVSARSGQQPLLQQLIQPRDAVQWTLYYLPVIDRKAAAAKSSENDPGYYTDRAAQLLRVGQVKAAKQDIDRALTLDANNSPAYALQAIIALTQNNKASALQLARKAVELNTHSAAAKIALSYAQQAHFDIAGALSSLQKAVQQNPDNALAWARLAELWLAVGDLDRGLEAAQKSVKLNPGLARTRSVQGFASLTRIDIRAAVAAFEQAIKLDSADPLARLGLGLAKIRDGKLQAGREEMEIAVMLDPGNALIRSYMGKAYFEEKRDKLAATQYERAKQLDPLDPTPWFYDAIRKQTVNRPGEALRDLQKSIELNDNRAVYRSRLLLDQDLAARSAGLARIYRDLGFEQLALVEGWKSVNTDPGNYSGHRFLADSYSKLPRHEIARVSELLQSQLLQPLNITPLQPQLAESNLFLLEGSGPSDSSFLEFNPLFARNRLGLQASGTVGGNDSYGDDLVISGIQDNWSYSLGQFRFESDGFRPNNDQQEDLYNLFVQGAVTHQTSVQVELRATDIERGDLPLRFDPGDFRAGEHRKIDSKSIRLGIRHAPTIHSDILVSAIAQDRDEKTVDSLLGSKAAGETNSYSGELQYLYRSSGWSLVSGLGYFKADDKAVVSQDLGFPLGTVTLLDQDVDSRHSNLYVYSDIKPAHDISVIFGASVDSFHDQLTDRDQFNPKLGVLWSITPATTLRVAAMRTLKRSLVAGQTVEPTQVAGFNQFFDDPDGSESIRYGLGLDHRFSPNLYVGAEASFRDVEAPFQEFSLPPNPPRVRREDSEERFIRAYLNWLVHDWWSVFVDYQFERFDRDAVFPPDANVGGTTFTDLNTHKLPLGLTFHHPRGWLGQVKASYVNQEGTFVTDPFFLTTSKDNDRFWSVDINAGYRLPGRHGLITIGVKNLFDESFKFQDTNAFNPTFYPERLVFGRLTLSF